ncbi:MAG: AAA family ATPase [Sporomusaceae bacterium]|nr:AAA family ATPase [Sporomusaceae bacterium]
MRPLKLTMTAFGPYASQQEIDFTLLGRRNLFVICGNTGAGKTTILDAIAYGLYGKASGQDRDGESLRSHFASEDILTAVELEFELKGERYYIRRVPKQQRKRLRGEGLMDQNAEAELQKLSGDAKESVCGIKEVNEKILQLLGITYDQFKQIIMIPQGEFRELLTADSKMREEILQKIFGTEGFRQVQQRLEEKAKALLQSVQEIKIKLGEAKAKLDVTDHAVLTDLVEGESWQAPALITGLKLALETDRQTLSGVDQQIKEQERLLQEKEKLIFQAESLNQKLAELTEAKQKLAELEVLQPQKKSQEILLKQARKALTILPQKEYLTRCADDKKIKTMRGVQASAAHKESLLSFQAAEAHYNETLKNEVLCRELLIEETQLTSLREKLEQLAITQKELAEEQKTLRLQEQQLTQNKKIIESDKEQLKDNKALLEKMRLKLESRAVKIEEKNHKEQRLQWLNKWSQSQAELEKLRSAYKIKRNDRDAAQKRYEACQTLYDEQYRLFLSGQASLLAKSLQAGEPCPVCGSANHPNPTVFHGDLPSEEHVKSLFDKSKALREAAEQSRIAFEQNYAEGIRQKKQVDEYLQELAALEGPELLEYQQEQLTSFIAEKSQLWPAEIQQLVEELGHLDTCKQQSEGLRQSIEQSEQAIYKQEQQVSELDQRHSQLLGQVQTKEALFKTLRSEVPEQFRSLALLEAKITEIQKRQETLKAALAKAEQAFRQSDQKRAQAETEQKQADEALLEAQTAFTAAALQWQADLQAADFLSDEMYEQAQRTPQEIQELEESVRAYELDLRAAQEHKIRLEYETQGVQVVDIALLQQEKVFMQSEREAFLVQKNKVAFRLQNNERQLLKLGELWQALENIEEEFSVVGHLARVAKGDNQEKLSFERYVLAAFFQDIIVAANLRLKKMTAGRYLMRRIASRGKGNGQSGLEIEVFDYYTGRTRHIKTLSGGESFKASLALALGLADVVQSYSGGIHIETMFIDEGFGTLDPESLDSAIETLMELQHSGRLVGIISHVPELKASVDARLEVQAFKNGSSAEFHIV